MQKPLLRDSTRSPWLSNMAGSYEHIINFMLDHIEHVNLNTLTPQGRSSRKSSAKKVSLKSTRLTGRWSNRSSVVMAAVAVIMELGVWHLCQQIAGRMRDAR